MFRLMDGIDCRMGVRVHGSPGVDVGGCGGAGRSGRGRDHAVRARLIPGPRAVVWVGVYVSLAVAFGLGLGLGSGWTAAGQFYAGI